MLSLQELWDLEIDIGLFILCPQFDRHNFKNITDKYKIHLSTKETLNQNTLGIGKKLTELNFLFQILDPGPGV